MTPGKEMPPRLLFDNAGRVGSSMQRKGGEGLDLRRGYEAPFLVSCHSKLRQISDLHKKKPFPFSGGITVGEKTVPGHSPPRITQRLEPQFTSELMSVKDQE